MMLRHVWSLRQSRYAHAHGLAILGDLRYSFSCSCGMLEGLRILDGLGSITGRLEYL